MVQNTQAAELAKQWFRAKLAAEKSKSDVVQKVKTGQGSFVVLDARDRVAYEQDHIPGALPMPLAEVEQLAAALDREKEYVTYCWNST